MANPELVHYGLTREEHASKLGIHQSCFENRMYALCANGSYHAKCTKVKAHVTCPACLAKLGKE